MDHLDIARDIVDALEDKKAENILLLDIRDSVIADYFIVCTGNSERQIKALAEGVRDVVKDKYATLPAGVEGEGNSGWVLMDYGRTVVHIFTEEQREYFNLEALWQTANVLVSIQ